MSFFEIPTFPELPPEPERPPQPEWAGPPCGVLPGQSPQQAVLFKTDEALLKVHQFLVYPTGVEFTFGLWTRHPDKLRPKFHWDLRGRRDTLAFPDRYLRLGLLLSDGTKWTNLEWPDMHRDRRPEHTEFYVTPRNGGGGDGQWRIKHWMWPLPPEGPLIFVAAWPAHAVEECRATIDATELRAHATEAEVIWPA